MRTLRDRLMRSAQPDAGVSIVEVLVAVMVFMIVSVGIAYATVAALRLSVDAQYREVAANLAAGEIDAVRAIGDPLNIGDSSSTTTIDDVTYTVVRDAQWVDSAGELSACGGGSGTLQYKAVNVSVSWTGKVPGSAPVTLDTIVAPDTRLNNPSYGTILVSVRGADGTGRSGVSVTATVVSGGSAVTIKPTDSSGCAFAFKVKPGTYSISVSKSGYISDKQLTDPSVTLPVTAGAASSASFQYDQAATVSLSYPVAGASGSVRLPNNLDVAFFNTYGQYTRTGGAPSSVQLHPFATGYSVVGGAYLAPTPAVPPAAADPGCVSPDPAAWAAGTVNDVAKLAGERVEPVSASPGSTASTTVPLGGVVVSGANNVQFRAVMTTPVSGSGDPGCGSSHLLTYTFSSLPSSGTYTLALPYGTWSIQRKSGSNWVSAKGLVSGVLDGAGGLLGIGNSGSSSDPVIVTVDPRGNA